MSNFKEIMFVEKPRTFMRGALILGSGVKHAFKNKGLLALALIPVVIALFSLSLGFGSLFKVYFSYASGVLLNEGWFDFWGGFVLLWISKLVLKILTGFLTFLTFYILLQVVYIPICSLLAEKVLKEKGIVQHETIWKSLAFNARMFRTGLIKAVALIFVGILCFVGSFIPVLNFMPIYFALIVLSYDSFDYGLELYGLSFGERVLFIRKEFVAINGHAGVLFLFSFIPGLILLTLPFSVIGASLLVGESDELKRTSTL
ncbi:MAG: EI24 domain-containing protein [Bdellovibrionales bacterium]